MDAIAIIRLCYLKIPYLAIATCVMFPKKSKSKKNIEYSLSLNHFSTKKSLDLLEISLLCVNPCPDEPKECRQPVQFKCPSFQLCVKNI